MSQIEKVVDVSGNPWDLPVKYDRHIAVAQAIHAEEFWSTPSEFRLLPLWSDLSREQAEAYLNLASWAIETVKKYPDAEEDDLIETAAAAGLEWYYGGFDATWENSPWDLKEHYRTIMRKGIEAYRNAFDKEKLAPSPRQDAFEDVDGYERLKNERL